MTNNISEQIKHFFEGKQSFKVYSLDFKSDDVLVKRPFLGVLSEASIARKLSISLSKDGFLEVSPLPKSEFSEFVDGLEKRFAKTDKNALIIILDPDMVKNIALANNKQEDAVFANYVSEKMAKAGVTKAEKQKISLQSFKDIEHNFLRTDFPSAFSIDGEEGKRISLIIAGNPDQSLDARVKDWLPDFDEKINFTNITRADFQKAVIYHEIGHSLDANLGDSDKVSDRLREESLADSFAVLQVAKDCGDTKFGRFFADFRMKMTSLSVEKLKPKDKKQALCYYTTPVLEATLKEASKALSNGSLQKMSDKEIFNLAQKITNQNVLNEKELDSVISGVLGEEKNKDSKMFLARNQASNNRLTVKEKTQLPLLEMGSYNPSEKWLLESYVKLSKIKEDDNSGILNFVNEARNQQRSEKINNVNSVDGVVETLLKRPEYVLEDVKNYKNLLNNINNSFYNIKEKDALKGYFESQEKLFNTALGGHEKGCDVFALEKASQDFAKQIVKDKDLFSKVKDFPELCEAIKSKSKGFAPSWQVNFLSDNLYYQLPEKEIKADSKILQKAKKALFCKSENSIAQIISNQKFR